MTSRCLRTGLSLGILMIVSLASVAAGQWTVTITPGLNPLPIGLCGAVQIALVDPTGNSRPRNALGFLMSLADFDMTVTSGDPRAVVGQQIDANHWSVCACQAGVAGTVATITATYPATRVAAKATVSGIPAQTTATLSLAAAKGSVEPVGCGAPTSTVIAAVATGTPMQQAPTVKTVVTAPAATAPVAASPVSGSTRVAPLMGPPPTGVTVTGTPTLAHVTWGLVSASSYSVQRWLQSNPQCCAASSPTMGARVTGWDDLLPSMGTYVYRVTANYADGRQGFVDVNYVAQATNPAVLTATWIGAQWQVTTITGFGQSTWWKHYVQLDWSKVPGAAYYILWGPGLPAAGTQLNTTVSNNVETHQTTINVNSSGASGATPFTSGVNTWTVAAYFLPGPMSTAPASFPTAGLTLPQCIKTITGACKPQ